MNDIKGTAALKVGDSPRSPYARPELQPFGSMSSITRSNAGSCQNDGNAGCGSTPNGMAVML